MYSRDVVLRKGRGSDLRRQIPSVDQLLGDPRLAPLLERHGRARVLEEVRRLLEEARERAAAADEDGVRQRLAEPAERLAERLDKTAAPSLFPLINATGVVIHTNLGRAPLAREVAERVAQVASSYANLELDLEDGERGNREVHAETRLRRLVGAEATAVVNNNAAAVLLAVNTLAEGREVIVSRGELVEIGGSFRIPDVLRKGGARLVEVGTTNRTRLSDYRSALSPETAMVLKVHRSNFRIDGFTESASLAELSSLCHERDVPLVEDLGSGLLRPLRGPLAGEPTVAQALEAGVAAVTWSGDKLLGGPQSGLIAGQSDPVRAMRKNPLYRALRVDKMTLTALDAVLADYEAERAERTVPVRQMLALDAETLHRRASAFVARLGPDCPGLRLGLLKGTSVIGGGSAPGVTLPTTLVTIAHQTLSAARLSALLRKGDPPVVARVADQLLLLDLRTVPEEQEAVLGAVVKAAAETGAGTPEIA